MAIFLVCILVWCILFWVGQGLLHCCLLWCFALFFSATRVPLMFGLGLWIHLYPLTEMCSFFFSWVSVMSAIDIFSVFRVVSSLFMLPLIPLTFMVAMVISLFFLNLESTFFSLFVAVIILFVLFPRGGRLVGVPLGLGGFFGFWLAFLSFHSLFSPSPGAGCHFLCGVAVFPWYDW